MNLSVLVPAVLAYTRQKGGYATKTKLLKLLYLLDIEEYRANHSTLTGFDWVFHKYGPWAQQYDAVLADLQAVGKIVLRAESRPELDTVFVDASVPISLSEAFPRFVDELRARRIIEAWADRPVNSWITCISTRSRCGKRGGESRWISRVY
jgi:hypothetical protein